MTQLIDDYNAAFGTWNSAFQVFKARRDTLGLSTLAADEQDAVRAFASAKALDRAAGRAEPSPETIAAELALEVAREAHNMAQVAKEQAATECNRARSSVQLNALTDAMRARQAELEAIESPSDEEAAELAAIVEALQ